MIHNGKDPRSWFRENSTLIYFLIAQVIAIGGGAAAMLAYFTKLETQSLNYGGARCGLYGEPHG